MSRSFLARLPAIRDCLGPVYAQPYRVASRIANALRCGYAVQRIEKLAECELLLVYVPDDGVEPVVAALAASAVDWTGKSIVLCESQRDSASMGDLTRRRAHVASLNSIEAFEERRFVAEGDGLAIRQLRRLIEQRGVKIFELRRGRKYNYMAGLTLATSLFTSLLDASAQSLRDGGMKPRAVQQIVERLFHEGLRAYLHAGRKSWGGPRVRDRADFMQAQIEALRRTNPVLAEYFAENLLLARRVLQSQVRGGRTEKSPGGGKNSREKVDGRPPLL